MPTRSQVRTLRIKLERQRVALVSYKRDAAQDMDILLESRAIEVEEVASEGNIAYLAELLSERGRLQLREVLAAIERIDIENYGVCEACGQDIPTARLRVLPETRKCVSCAATAEHQGVRGRTSDEHKTAVRR